jgi:predicted ATPase
LLNNFILITGCSGGGKSTFLDALSSKGYETIAEPGRRIIEAARAGSDENLPWVDMKAFARCAFDMANSDLMSASRMAGNVFFDRGVVDAAVALQAAGGDPYRETLGPKRHYSKTVFLAPPWPEVFREDEARRHGFKSASEECHRLEKALDELGYRTCVLPKVSVEERVAFVLDELANLLL